MVRDLSIAVDRAEERADIPRYPDRCGHRAGEYVGSFAISTTAGLEWHDLYVFEDAGRQHVCIRYGDEPSAYMSPGCILDMVVIGGMHRSKVYLAALSLLADKGRFTWRSH